MTRQLSAGRILVHSFASLRHGGLRAGVALVAMASLGILIDSGFVSQRNVPALNLVVSGVNIAASYWITKALLEERADRHLDARFPAFFGLGLLSSLGILLGAVMLVVPGIILFVRWSASGPILIGGGDSVTEAMQQSWRLTGPHFWPILLVFLALYGSSLAIAVAAFALADAGLGGIASVALADLAFNAGLIAGWHASVAIYALLEGPDRLAETFA